MTTAFHTASPDAAAPHRARCCPAPRRCQHTGVLSPEPVDSGLAGRQRRLKHRPPLPLPPDAFAPPEEPATGELWLPTIRGAEPFSSFAQRRYGADRPFED